MRLHNKTSDLLELGKALETERRSASEKFTIVQNAVAPAIKFLCTDIKKQLIEPSVAHSEKRGIASSVKDAKDAARALDFLFRSPLDLSIDVSNVAMTRYRTVNSLLLDHFSSTLSSFTDGLGKVAQLISDGKYTEAGEELEKAGSTSDDPIRRSLLAEKAATDVFLKSAATLLVIERTLGDFRKEQLSISAREARDRIMACLANTTIDDLQTAALDDLSKFVWTAFDLSGDVFSLNAIWKWVIKPIKAAFGRRSLSFDRNHLDTVNRLRDLVEEAQIELSKALEEAKIVKSQLDNLREYNQPIEST